MCGSSVPGPECVHFHFPPLLREQMGPGHELPLLTSYNLLLRGLLGFPGRGGGTGSPRPGKAKSEKTRDRKSCQQREPRGALQAHCRDPGSGHS